MDSPIAIPSDHLSFYVQGPAFFTLVLTLLGISFLSSAISPPVLWTLLALSLTCLGTRVLTGRNVKGSHLQPSGSRSIPRVPYWIPLLGHIPSLAYNADGFLRGLRQTYGKGIFSLNLGGRTHHVLYTPGLTTALLDQPGDHVNGEGIARGLLRSVFGFPRRELGKYDAALPELMACYKHLLAEPWLGRLVASTAATLKKNVTDLVTGNESLVDQMLWERGSMVKVITTKSAEMIAEASLLPLVRDFCAHSTSPSMMGSNFLENFPDFFDEIWTLDRGFSLLATGLPRWLPIPALLGAHIAKRKSLNMLWAFHEALEKEAEGNDPGAEWQGLEDVGVLVKARLLVYRKYGFSIAARAAAEHALIWAANANSGPLIFWMLNRIYADRVLLEMLREEMAPYVGAVQPAKEFEFVEEPPRFEKFDVEGLCTSCPLLKSCYLECLRLDSAAWSLREVKRDLLLQVQDKGAQAWAMKKGDYVHAAHGLHNTNPDYFSNPLAWKADRHIKDESDEKKASVDRESIRPYGESLIDTHEIALLMILQEVVQMCAKAELSPSENA